MKRILSIGLILGMAFVGACSSNENNLKITDLTTGTGDAIKT